ncbi:MAG: hypothetical protein L0Z50_12245, partial [Verrucomicrobiales bacterium]|nr:hypothetical protein [Verrucomicrobiales bacterium]
VNKEGRALNLDFEDGTLRDWTASGNAFDKQPVRGDTVAKRRGDMRSDHQGEYWIGGYEFVGDDPHGMLASAPFLVTQPWCSFIFAGGAWPNTRMELVRADTQRVFFKISGVESENLRPVVVNLQEHLGKEILVRLIDQQSGHWGHLNFDNFLFHAAKPNFPNTLDPERVAVDAPPPADVVKFGGLPAAQAAREITLPSGFKAYLFAGEPDIQQPIAFCFDDRGRVWVAEGRTYPKRRGHPPRSAPILDAAASKDDGASRNSQTKTEGNALRPGRPRPGDGDATTGTQPTSEQLKDIFSGLDRILVFEDTNGDHAFDKRTVFLENVNLISGLEIGFGGLWIGAAPYLLFVPVGDADEPKPAGDPRILLDGWDYTRDTHETLNTFRWGPDGWLYGCHGVFCPSHVGKPGAPENERQWMDAGVWRYHPTRHVFEVFTEGGSNPWGIDFNEQGQLFAEMCVIPHFWHMIQGARLERQGGEHFPINREETARHEKHRDARSRKPIFPHVYEDIKQHGDHVHWAGNRGPHAANARSDSMGGGHAHAGVMCYLGTSWPEEYRGKLFIGNIHGQRLNMDIPERHGSGYVGRHGKDFLNFNDSWSQTLDQRYDQDGSAYVIDWYDKNQCHHNREDGHDRSNGRIYKIVHHDQKVTKVDLSKKSDDELLALVTSKNEWMSQHARRLLQERFSAMAPLLEEYRQKVAASSHSDAAQKADPKWIEAWNRQIRWVEWANAALNTSTDAAANLRVLWLAHVANLALTDEASTRAAARDEWFRAWRVQLTFERAIPSGARMILEEIRKLAPGGKNAYQGMLDVALSAARDESPVVRAFAAGALQRIPSVLRWEPLKLLLSRAEDADDHNLPLMYWYAAEACAASDPDRAIELLTNCKIPKVREFIARRLATTSLTAAK